jgi:hypothetical protein
MHLTAFLAGALAASPADPGSTSRPTRPADRTQDAAKSTAQDADVDDLAFRVESLELELERLRREAATPPPAQANRFNPQITVFGNFLARSDDQPVHLEDDPAEPRIDDSLNLREVEVDFRAAIDPFADGVLILAAESEVPGEYEAAVEEGYATLKSLPGLESAPLGLKLKAGRFRAGFGRFNRIHLHDLPQVDYPRSLQVALGEEGYVQNGVSGSFFLPSPSESSAIEGTLELLGGGDVPMADDLDAGDVAGLARLAWFQELGASHSVDSGASWWTSQDERELYGVDLNYKWRPHEAGNARSFLLGGELFSSDGGDSGLDDALGWFAWSQVQFSRSIYLGVRYDRSEELADASLETTVISAFATWYTSEFLRLRLGGSGYESDVAEIDGRTSLFLELNFVFGSHPVEPYWVNR